MIKVVAVLRVSKGATNGASLKVQRSTIEAAAKPDWDIEWIEETVTGTGKRARPKLDAALDALDRGDADLLVVSKVDRLSRSIIAFAQILKRSRANGWSLIALDMGVDFNTPSGKLLGNQMISFAEYEAEIIGARTKDALRVKRAEGKAISRPTVTAVVAKRIRRQHRQGWSLAKIAARLNSDAIPTARGGREWHRSTVRGVLQRA